MIECINKYKSKTSRKSIWFLDNEADEIYSIESYLHYLDIFQTIVRRNGFEVGAGNFQFRKDYIMGLVFHKDLYDIMGIHMQNGFEDAGKIETNGNWYKQLKNTYKLRMTCTEAIPTGWNLNEHYPLVIKQLLKAIDIGCEDLCVIFIHGGKPEMLEKYRQLTFTLHPAIWTDFKRIIKDNKPTIKKEEDMILDNLYYKDRPEEKYVRDPEKRGIKFLRACFKLSDSNLFDAALDSEIRLYQANKGFVVDGKVGPETLGGLILEADYQKYYNWVQHDWATYS